MGGKISHLNWLLPLLPYTDTYVEPYGGCMAALLNKKKSPIEVYNDINSEVYNLFKVIREDVEELKRQLDYTLISREEYRVAAAGIENCDDIEKARLFFIKLLQSRLNNPTNNKEGSWNFSTKREGDRNYYNMKGSQCVTRFINKVDMLPIIADRIRLIQIEKYPAIKVLELYDSPNTLFYVDPPYPHESRTKHNIYKYEMGVNDHRELAAILMKAKGLVAVSGYDCDLMEELYRGWHKHKEKIKSVNYNPGVKGTRQEVLWTNYDIDAIKGQLTLD